MTRRFENCTVIVTGSAAGIGRAFALGFAGEGARLILIDVDAAGLIETAAQLHATGAEAETHVLDLASEPDIHATAATIAARHPRIDVLINNAGLAYGEIASGFEALGQARWLRFLSINTVAPLLLAQALRGPLAAGPGVIVNQSSMASYVPGTAYGVTKAALNAMTFGMANSFGRDGIRVVGIAPGLMETPAARDGVDPANYARIQAMQILDAHGTADDIVQLALFLASDAARFITNEIVHCDAGNRLRGWRG